jgi:hypothetical protein
MVPVLETLSGAASHPAGEMENEKSYFWADASPVNEKVCPNRQVSMLYQLMFRGLDLEHDAFKRECGRGAFDI